MDNRIRQVIERQMPEMQVKGLAKVTRAADKEQQTRESEDHAKDAPKG